MTIRDQVETILEAVKPWAADRKGKAVLCADVAELAFKLLAKPGGVTVFVVFSGEAQRGGFEECGQVDRSFQVTISRTAGMTKEPGDTLTKGAAGGAPLLDLVEELRELLRGLSFTEDTTDWTPNVKNIAPYVFPDGTAANAYVLDLSIGTQLPAVTVPEE